MLNLIGHYNPQLTHISRWQSAGAFFIDRSYISNVSPRFESAIEFMLKEWIKDVNF
jgi:hypothetical protein